MARNDTPNEVPSDDVKAAEDAEHPDAWVYPVPDTSGRPVFARLAVKGEIARFNREHDFEPVTGDNPVAAIRAAEQAAIEAGESTHYGW